MNFHLCYALPNRSKFHYARQYACKSIDYILDVQNNLNIFPAVDGIADIGSLNVCAFSNLLTWTSIFNYLYGEVLLQSF